MATPKTLPTASLSLHPEAALVPEMPADQYALFLADVKGRGILKPIELVPGTRTVVEGRTRLKAAIEAGLSSVPVVDADLRDDTPVMYMLRSALLRRHLTKSQAAALAVEIEAVLSKAAKERQREGGRKGGEAAGRGRPQQVVSNPPQPKPAPAPKSRDVAAVMAGSSPRAVSDAKKVKKEAPELFQKLKEGTLGLAEATRIVKGPAAEKPADKPPTPHAPPAKPPAPKPECDSTSDALSAPSRAAAVSDNFPVPFLITELEETVSWLNERADVIEGIIAGVAVKSREALQVEVARLRGRVAIIRQAVKKARDTQWDKESKK